MSTKTVTGAELLELLREHGPFFGESELARIEDASRCDQAPEDKWGAGFRD
jgi:hypothetical protein